jgi:hypothetical protein
MARKTVTDDTGNTAAPQRISKSNDGEFAALREVFDRAYDEGTTLEEAERLGAKFLSAQMNVADELAIVALDARMKKSGLKAIKSAVYMRAATSGDKKPSDSFLENLVNLDEMVSKAQDTFDQADARRESLELYFGIFREAHLYFRAISKGTFGG